MKLSIIIPVYNEKSTILAIVKKVLSAPYQKEVIIVDDCSNDGTRDLLKTLNDKDILLLFHDKNCGKGKAIQTALEKVTGDIVLIQDADMEYDPAEYPSLLAPILDGRADVVYGSRFLGAPHRVLLFWHYLGNLIFTLLANVLYNINLTDMGTCYKALRTEVIKALDLKSLRFGIEAEITAKVCKRKLRIFETPISYNGRTYREGKKITWRDSFVYLYSLLRFRFFD